jgi:hypothetical protein
VASIPLLGCALDELRVRFWSIVLKKSFLGDERNFKGPLMRIAGGDVGDHVVAPKIDHGSS